MNYTPTLNPIMHPATLALGLQLTPSERLSRVQSDMRLGLPCLLNDGQAQVVVAPVETVSAERLEALTSFLGQPQLVLTGRRAAVVLGAERTAAVRVVPPASADLAWFQTVADATCDRLTAPMGSLDVQVVPGMPVDDAAVTLVKHAALVPAVLVFEMRSGAVVPQGLALSEVSVADVTTFAAHAPELTPVAAASLPIAAHDTGQLTVFRDMRGLTEHYAFIVGNPDADAPVLTRLHSACFTGDVLGSLKCDCGPQLHAALAQMGQAGAGVLLYLNQEGRGIGLANKMRVYDLQAQGYDTVDANHRMGFEDDERDFRLASVMLRTLGFEAVRLLTNNPRKVTVMGASGVEVVERVPLRVGENPHNTKYLAVKAQKSGHAL